MGEKLLIGHILRAPLTQNVPAGQSWHVLPMVWYPGLQKQSPGSLDPNFEVKLIGHIIVTLAFPPGQ